ncbi:MAG: PIG-L family deacetylase [Myxococcales bacterium]|nr:PIG-L family deacetylase [Myxococcales bacterium]
MNDPLEVHPSSRVLVLAAHPDDETLGAGGLIQRALAAGAAARVVFATSGDNNPWPQRALERRWRIGPAERARWGARRRAEALEALACLGVSSEDVVFLDYPDRGLTDLLLKRPDAWLDELARVILDWEPTLVVAPSVNDRHPDHSALAVAVALLRFRRTEDRAAWALLSYGIHGPRRGRSEDRTCRRSRLSAEELEGKRRALLRHRTQLALSRRRFLRYVREEEIFEFGPVAASTAEHAVGRVLGEAGDFVVEIARPRGWIWRRRLLIAQGGDGKHGTMEIPLAAPRRGVADAPVRDLATGEIVGVATWWRDGRGLRARLPRELFEESRRVFAKLVEPVVFLDAAGWCALASPSSTADVLGAPAPVDSPYPRVAAIIPCFNVARLCESVVRETAGLVDHVIVVDDGSDDGTGALLDGLAAELGDRLTLLRFAENRGKGVALLEAFRFAMARDRFDILVTLDADRQHRPVDIPALVGRCAGGADLVVGARTAVEAMPARSRLGNVLMTRLLRRLFPAAPPDTQSGMRAHGAKFAREILAKVRGRRYETEMMILLFALRGGHTVASVPIPTIYQRGNPSSHFRPFMDSARILWAIVVTLARP